MKQIRRTLWFLIVLGVAAGTRTQAAEKPILVLDAGGHTAAVRKVIFSRDGKELISVSNDKTIRVWDVTTGQPLRVLRPPIGNGPEGEIFAAALAPNGDTLAIGGWGSVEDEWHPIYLLSLATGQIQRVLTGHQGPIFGLHFDAEGQRLASGSADETARIWNVGTGKTEQVLKGHSNDIFGVAFSPDGRRCATASIDKTAAIWNVATGERLATLSGHTAEVQCIAWRPDGLVIATGSNDHSIRLWGSDGKVFRGFDKLGEKSINSVTFAAGGHRLLYTQGYGKTDDKSITAMLDVATGREVTRFDQHTNTIQCGALSPDGELAATTGDTNYGIFVWKTSNGRLVHKFSGRGRIPYAAAWSPDETRIAWGNGATVGVESEARPLERTFSLLSLEFGSMPDERFMRARSERGNLSLIYGKRNQYGFRSSVLVRQGDRTQATLAEGDPDSYTRINCFTLLTNDRAALGATGGLLLFDTRTGKQICRSQNGDQIYALSPSPGGKYLLSADEVMTLRVWDPDAIKNKASIAGIGAPLKKVEGGFEVGDLVVGAPASTDGRLKTGDVITAVNSGAGQFTETHSLRLKECVNLIRGEIGTNVGLKVRSKDGKEKTIELIRGGISIPKDIEPLLSCFFAGDDWIAWTPEGYYAASPGGEKLMGWHVNNGREQMASFYPASQFRSTLYRPDVIKLLLKTGSVERALEEADKARGRMTVKTDASQVLPPQVRIIAVGRAGDVNPPRRDGSSAAGSGEEKTLGGLTSPARLEVGSSIEVRATATSVGNHPVTALRLLLDGRPYQGLKGVQTIADSKPGEVSRSWTVELEPGKHKLKVLADSAVSQGASEEVEVIYIGGDADPVRLPNLYVVAIGITEYPGDLKLNYAAKDAEALGNALKSHSKSLFRDIEVQTITDAKATRADVLKGLSWLRGQMTQSDYGIFFFAGHGDLDNDGSLYFLPVDGDSKDLVSTAVPADQVKRVLSGIPGKLITMLDACHSAGIAGSQTGKRRAGQASLTDDLVRDLVTDENGVIAMCSSTGREFSLENNQFRQGSFTLAVVEGLSGKADFNKDGVVYLNELDTYVTDRVKELTKGQQHPVTAKPGSIRSFPLAKP